MLGGRCESRSPFEYEEYFQSLTKVFKVNFVIVTSAVINYGWQKLYRDNWMQRHVTGGTF